MSVPPTLVPWQDKRIVSVATSCQHCLALTAEGEYYSWGEASFGALGHPEHIRPTEPRRIETLERVESVAAGHGLTSAAVDDRGRLFTWGRAYDLESDAPTGLGYYPKCEGDEEAKPTPTMVDALSEERVVGVALGDGFTLVVTDAGAVFSFGHSSKDALGHGSPESTGSRRQQLPRKIDALAVTGRRFVAVAAGEHHSLALTEEGHVYGWDLGFATGHGQDEDKFVTTPQRLTALDGERITLVYAHAHSSSAVTEKGELFTWGQAYWTDQHEPECDDGLLGVKVAAVAACSLFMLVADEDSNVWAFGRISHLGTGAANAPVNSVGKPAQIPNLRVWIP